MLNRRGLLTLGAAAALIGLRSAESLGQSAANQWFAVTSDDGKPIPNLRIPVELTEEIEDLPGAVWGGPPSATVTLVEFYDYNCPWCRAASTDLGALMRSNPDLRVGQLNNPILSPASAQAARVELAVLKLKGAGAAHSITEALFSIPGRIDGSRALEAAQKLGLDRQEVERMADGQEVKAMLRRQMGLAASMGLVATPSYVVSGAAVLGYPGPNALRRIVANARLCGTISC